jgi:hypothetical protein
MKDTKHSSKQVALGGVLAALAVVVLLLGGLIPIGTYLAPMLASLPLVVLLAELPKGLCVGWYAVTAVLGVLLCPDRETAFVFVFLGWYPLVRPALDRLPRLPRLLMKLLLFLTAVAALYALLILAFRLEALVAEAGETGLPLLIALLILGSAAFLLFDRLLSGLTTLYKIKRKK